MTFADYSYARFVLEIPNQPAPAASLLVSKRNSFSGMVYSSEISGLPQFKQTKISGKTKTRELLMSREWMAISVGNFPCLSAPHNVHATARLFRRRRTFRANC